MYFAGIDIGGTKCAALIARADSEKVEILRRREIPTVGQWHEILGSLVFALKQEAKEMGLKENAFARIGIACGGPLDTKRGEVLSPPNLPGWENVPIRKYFEDEFGVSARLMNDADACAVAEWRYGAGRGTEHMAFLTFGTGMGAGLILNGKLYEGASSCAGEIGHIRLNADGPVGYGKRGSFEGYCSGGGIARLARSVMEEKMQAGKNILFPNDISAKTLADAARRGDEDALQIFRESGRMLGTGLAVLIDVLNPQKIILGGVFMRAHGLMESEMYEVLKRECLSRPLECVKIEPSLLGERIGDYGAIVAGMYDFSENILRGEKIKNEQR